MVELVWLRLNTVLWCIATALIHSSNCMGSIHNWCLSRHLQCSLSLESGWLCNILLQLLMQLCRWMLHICIVTAVPILTGTQLTVSALTQLVPRQTMTYACAVYKAKMNVGKWYTIVHLVQEQSTYDDSHCRKSGLKGNIAGPKEALS